MQITWGQVLKYIDEAKLIIGSISVVVASLVGGYHLVTDYFVTKAYAREMESSLKQMIRSQQLQTQQNSIMLMELKLSEYERRLAKGEKLTATEERQYQRLLKIYDKALDSTPITQF